MKLVRVAGGIVWRELAAGPRIAVVHRARRDDWSLPKGRLEPGEAWHQAARRELGEETGCDVSLDAFAGAKLLLDRPDPKLVLYWHARVARLDAIPLDDEIDDVAWLSRREALDRLDHVSDRHLLLRALAGREPSLRRADGGAHPTARDLRSLVVLDCRRAEDALPSVLGLISRAASPAAARRDVRQA